MYEYLKELNRDIEDRDPNVMWFENGGAYVFPFEGRYAVFEHGMTIVRDADVLFHTPMVRLGAKNDSGRLVSKVTPSWDALRGEILKDPRLMRYFPICNRTFEEFVAGGYVSSDWKDVVLTPRSNDGGFDIAAKKNGIHVFDEAKAYKPTLRVKHTIVRAALGLLIEHRAMEVNRVCVTTTSTFASKVFAQFAHLIPDTLTLRDRDELLRWLRSFDNPQAIAAANLN